MSADLTAVEITWQYSDAKSHTIIYPVSDGWQVEIKAQKK